MHLEHFHRVDVVMNVEELLTKMMVFDINSSNLCPSCLHDDGHYVKLEPTESMLLMCKRRSRAYEAKPNGK